MSRRKFSYRVFAGTWAMFTFLYVVVLPALGAGLAWIHPWLAIVGHTFWYGMLTVLIALIAFMPSYQLSAEIEDGDSLSDGFGVFVAAMLAFPLHFALICRAVENGFPGQFASASQASISLDSWLHFALHNTLDTLIWSAPSLYELISTEVSPQTQLGKAVVLVFRLSLTFLYVAAAFRVFKVWRQRSHDNQGEA